MPDHELPRFSEAIKYLDSLRDWLTELQSIAPTTPPEFTVGQEVIVWETGERVKILHRKHFYNNGPKNWCGPLDAHADGEPLLRRHGEPDFGVYAGHEDNELLLIPTQPDSTDAYDVGEWARPEEGKHEGWLDYAPAHAPIWMGPAKGMWLPSDVVDKGYRWTITRVPKAKFAKGQRVHCGCSTWRGDAVVDAVKRIEQYWRYNLSINPGSGIAWVVESDLEALPNEASRQNLPPQPPAYKPPGHEHRCSHCSAVTWQLGRCRCFHDPSPDGLVIGGRVDEFGTCEYWEGDCD